MNFEAKEQLRHIMAPLDVFRSDPKTTDIMINQPDEVFVRQNGQYFRHTVDLSYDDCLDMAILAGSINRQNVDHTTPIVNTELPDGERFHAVIPPCVPTGRPSIAIRVHEADVAPIEHVTQRYDLSRWNRWDRRNEVRKRETEQLLAAYDSGDIIRFFRECVRLKFTLVLTGATGAGKSTMLKTLVSLIERHERIITIENALELDIVNQPNHVRLLYSHGDQSTASVGQDELLQALLRMRPDRNLVGELRDPEATYTFISELTTGHPGSATTIHGSTAAQAALRLFTLFKASAEGKTYEPAVVKDQLANAIDVIVPFRESDGQYSIGEVWLKAEAERRNTTLHELFEAV